MCVRGFFLIKKSSIILIRPRRTRKHHVVIGCYKSAQTTQLAHSHVNIWQLNDYNVKWVKYKRRYQVLSEGIFLPFIFNFTGLFSTFKGIFFSPSALLLIFDPANKIQIVIHPIFPNAAMHCQTLSSPHAKI